MRLIDAHGSYTINASDNTGYSLVFGGGIISVADEFGHIKAEFDADDANAIDTVPVVLCRDCKFIIDRNDGTHGCYRHFLDECEPDDFCSYGERSTTDGFKPCPFCGSRNIGIVYTRANGIPSGDDGWRAEIKCKCGANMKFWALEKLWAKESITKAWNRRVGEEEQDG